MANRKKEELNFCSDMQKLNFLLEQDYGGEKLIISSLEDLKQLKDVLNSYKNLKFLDMEYIYKENFLDYIYDIYGLIVILGDEKEINIISSQISYKDVSIILVCKEFFDISYIPKIKPYYIFVCQNWVSKKEICIAFIKFNIFRFLYYVDNLIKTKATNEYLKLQNLSIDEDYETLIEKILKDYFKFSEVEILKNLDDYSKSNIVFIYNIWIEFVVNYFNYTNCEKENFINQSNLLYMTANLNSLKRDIEEFKKYFIDDYLDFKNKFNKDELMKFFTDFIENSKQGHLVSYINKKLAY